MVSKARSRSRMRKIGTLNALLKQFCANRQRLKHFEGAGMNHAGARGIGAGGLAIDDQAIDALALQFRGERQAAGAGTHDHYLCLLRQSHIVQMGAGKRHDNPAGCGE